MSYRHVSFSVLLMLLVIGSVGVVVADHHEKDASGAVSAESDPGHADAHDDAHGAVGDGHDDHGDSHGADAHHNPFDDAMHGNATPTTHPLSGQDNLAEWKTELAIWSFVVFACLCAVLWKFAWTPICDALEAREKSVQQNIDAAKEQAEKASALLAEHEARLAGTADEVRRILDEARRDAETQKQGILAEAEAASEAQKARALQEIDAAKNGALQELAEKSVDTAVGLAGQIVQRQLSADDHAALISEAVKHFPSKN